MFSKKDKNESELPDLPEISTPFQQKMMYRDDEDFDDRTLPSFPNTLRGNEFSQAAIKDAVSYKKETSAFNASNNVNIAEMEEWAPETDEVSLPEPKIEEPREMILPPPESIQLNTGKANKDIFIKLDRFYSGRRALRDIKDKLEQVDNMIKKIKEIKMREEQEIASWEKDLMHARTRIQDVSENIFEKLE